MKIDWKQFSKTKGYISCKQEMINCIRRKHRSKEQCHRHFQWILGKAKHYSHKLNIPIKEILDLWEEKRTYNWLNFYQNSQLKRICKSIARRENG